MKKTYACSVCEKENVKLWRPYMGTEPLICAVCAEKRQSPRKYDECIWEEREDKYIGIPTGRKLPLAKWKIDDEGKIPSFSGPGHDGKPLDMTDQLEVDLRKISSYTSGKTTMIAAIPDEYGGFWGYTSVPQELCKWWTELPTR